MICDKNTPAVFPHITYVHAVTFHSMPRQPADLDDGFIFHIANVT